MSLLDTLALESWEEVVTHIQKALQKLNQKFAGNFSGFDPTSGRVRL